MEHFLSTGQAADYLGISIDTLNSRIRAGDFPPPDAIIGDRYQGWTRASLARWYSKDRENIYCDPTKVTEIINRIRRIAETIRGHGRLPYSPGVSAQVPRALYALTGLIESELRRLVTWNEVVTDEAGISRIDFDLPPAPSLAVHPNLNLTRAEPTLYSAADELDALAHELRRALISRPARTFDDTLAEQAAIVRRYADEIHTAAAAQREETARAQPGLTVVFDPSDPACVQNRRDHPQRDFQLRLRATNTGRVTLTGVRCRLKAGHDHYGRIRHDNTPPYDPSHNGITLQPGASDYFDIAFCHFDQPQMVLQYADAYLLHEQTINQTPKTTNTPVEVTFEARREDTNEWIPTITRHYVVAPDGDAITLTEADTGGGAAAQPFETPEEWIDAEDDL